MAKYVSRKMEIEAEIVTKENWINVQNLLGENIGGITVSFLNLNKDINDEYNPDEFYLDIPTLEGTMRAQEGDYLVKGIKGEFYPVKPDIFRMKYFLKDSPEVLKNAVFYLAGPIENSKDFGVGWRDKFISACTRRGLDIKFINPCKKPENCIKEISDGSDARTVDELRHNKDWQGMHKFVKSMRREDLRFVAIGDCLILYVDPTIHMCGSYEEYFLAEYQRKPVFIIVEGGIEKLPTWLFGSADDLNTIFSTEDECADYLVQLNSGEIPLNDKWLLIRDYLDRV